MAVMPTIKVKVVTQPRVRIKTVPQPKIRMRATPALIPADGEAATIEVGTVTTLPAGSPATVTNVGNENAAVFDFGLPRGESGAVESIVAGANVSVDDTDPANPIVSASGDVASVNGQTGTVVLDAGDIGVTPSGGISATDVQAALEELDSDNDARFVATRTALKALDTDAYTVAFFDGSQWDWTLGDHTDQIAADTVGGIYVKANAVAETVGAWRRRFDKHSARFYGASADASRSDNAAALQVAVDVAALFIGDLHLPEMYPTDTPVEVSATLRLSGVSPFTSGISNDGGDAIVIVPSTSVANNNTWWGFNSFAAVSTHATTGYGIRYTATGGEYLSNWIMESVYASGPTKGAVFDSTGSTVGIFCCTLRRNFFANGVAILDGGDSITFIENTANGQGIGVHVDGLKTGARQLVIRNNNFTTLSECIWIEGVTGALIAGNWAETPSYLGSYDGTSGALVNIQDSPNARVYQNTLQPLDEVGGGFVGANYSIRVGGTSTAPIIDDNDIADGQSGHINIDGSGVTNAYIGWRNRYAETAVITDTGTGTSIEASLPPLGAANTWSAAQTIDTTAAAVPQLIVRATNDTASPGPMIQLDRLSANPAASDVLGYVQFAGYSSTGVQREFGGLRMFATAVTNGAESGSFDFITIASGAAGVRARLQSGLQVGAPTGLDKGSGTVNVSGGYYVNGVQMSPPGAPVTKTGNFTVAATEQYLINNKSGSSCTITLPTASSFPGRELHLQSYQSQTAVSASANVVQKGGATTTTAILPATIGAWCTLVSDGTNWVIMRSGT